MFDINFIRRIPRGKYAYDEVHISVSGNNPADVVEADYKAILSNISLQAAALLPLDMADTGDEYPQAPAAHATVSGFDPDDALNKAERVLSPVGPSTGYPLGACSDEDLLFYSTKYKKTEDGVKQAATIIRAARMEGRTHVKPASQLM